MRHYHARWTRYYTVTTREFGELAKAADNIADARRWAYTAFPGERPLVRRLFELRPLCSCCGSRPCIHAGGGG